MVEMYLDKSKESKTLPPIISKLIGVLFILFALLAAWGGFTLDMNTPKTIALFTSAIFSLALGTGLFAQKQNLILISSRWFVGLVFIFSGIVKAVDPLGSKYKFIDYFEAFGLDFMIPFALPLAFVLSGIEFLVGASLILNAKPKLSMWAAFLFMLGFTPLTLYLAFENPVTDCGCFGDAIILTNWQTFWKNIVIFAFVIIAFYYRKQFQPAFNNLTQIIIVLAIALITLGFEWYNYQHLPIWDFRPYKVATYIPEKMQIPEGEKPDKYVINYTMKNSETGETMEINSDEYTEKEIWKDTTWVIEKASDPILVEKGYTPPIHDLEIYSNEPEKITGVPQGENILDIVLSDPNYNFWLVSYDLSRADTEAMKQANEIAEFAKKNDYKFYCLTASGQAEINKMRNKINPVFNFYSVDEITLKTIVRANPGLVLLKEGHILAKWHYNDYPPIDNLPEIMKQAEKKVREIRTEKANKEKVKE